MLHLKLWSAVYLARGGRKEMEQGAKTPRQELFWRLTHTACLPRQAEAFIAHHMHLASALRLLHFLAAYTPQNIQHTGQLSTCTVAWAAARLCKHWEHLVITSFTQNYRSNSAFSWEQIRHDIYIQDTWQSITDRDCSSLTVGLEMSGQQIQCLRRILAAPASRHLLSAPGLTVTFLTCTSVIFLQRNVTDTTWLQMSMTTASTLTEENTGKNKSPECPDLWYITNFTLEDKRVMNLLHCQNQVLPTGISFKLQRKTRRMEEGGLGTAVTPKLQHAAACRNDLFLDLKQVNTVEWHTQAS